MFPHSSERAALDLWDSQPVLEEGWREGLKVTGDKTNPRGGSLVELGKTELLDQL
jgi:hypothetical protein